MTYRVLITTPHPEWPLWRQAPQQVSPCPDPPTSSGVSNAARKSPFSDNHAATERIVQWGDCTFFIDLPVREADAWVVFENLSEPTRAQVPPERTILITGEPPSIRSYRTSYLQQFAHIVTCHSQLRLPSNDNRPKVHNAPQGLPWHIGVNRLENDRIERTFEQLAQPKAPPKNRLISVICSNKSMTRGHMLRQQFVARLAEHFGGCLDVFGRGHREVGDKWDAIAPYHYHIVLENESVPDYFSEKLTDCYLAGAYPFYYGCPNVRDYFPADSLTSIDILDPESAIEKIERAFIADLFGRHQQSLDLAKDLVVNQYNLFPLIANFVHKHFASRRNNTYHNSRPLTIYPRRHRWGLEWAKLDRFSRSLVTKHEESPDYDRHAT
jgi:hypothetical protein